MTINLVIKFLDGLDFEVLQRSSLPTNSILLFLKINSGFNIFIVDYHYFLRTDEGQPRPKYIFNKI